MAKKKKGLTPEELIARAKSAVDVEILSKSRKGQLARADDALPETVICLPMNQRPVFPTMMLPLMIPEGPLTAAVRYAVEKHDGHLGFFLTLKPLEEEQPYGIDDLYKIGCIARVSKVQEVEDIGLQVFAEVVGRFEIVEQLKSKAHVLVRGRNIRPTVNASDSHVRALAMAIVTALKELVPHNPVFADEIKLVLSNYNNIDGPGRLADLAASLTTANRGDIQAVLECFDVEERMEKVLVLLAKESELTQLKSKIQHQIEGNISEHQRKFFLNEQLKAIKQELGIETDEKSLDIKKFSDLYEQKKDAMSDEVREATNSELSKINLLDPSSSEYGVSRNRLEWLTEMPWGNYTSDNLNLTEIRDGLNSDHYGMDDIKDRFIEFCGVRKLKDDRGGGIITLVGPPGTGKTSIGASIAKHLGRKFFRLSVGGMRDEAEIKGHRRTYVGALPGKLAQALRRCDHMNPVILLDEIDKLSHGHQGDPASALLEVLDPEQNKDFLDHYLDVRIDLSQVLFICTANDLGGIPEPLRDRMEIMRLAGYIETEKVTIASSYLVPKQRTAHGLRASDIQFPRSGLSALTRGYAREAGVRQLEQLIAKVCRKVATQKAELVSEYENKQKNTSKNKKSATTNRTAKNKKARNDVIPWKKVIISNDTLHSYLGKPYMSDEELMSDALPGVVTGLAWTSMGGATLEIEAIASAAEKGGLTLTGQLGDVMKESVSLTKSYLHAHAANFGIAADWFDSHHVHIHFPAGATPKDGPSAGAAIACTLLSLIKNKAVKRKLGMTGELTITGRIYPIGGVREKIVASKRAGLKTIILPRANERDHDELPEHLKKGYSVHFVDTLDQVFTIAGLI